MEDIFVARSDREIEFEKFKMIRNISEIMYRTRYAGSKMYHIYL